MTIIMPTHMITAIATIMGMITVTGMGMITINDRTPLAPKGAGKCCNLLSVFT